jgi:hypothetical protein
MLKNITLSAEEKLIERARRRAAARNTTINAEFRRWLAQYADAPQSLEELASLMSRYRYARPGKTFTREELNER